MLLNYNFLIKLIELIKGTLFRSLGLVMAFIFYWVIARFLSLENAGAFFGYLAYTILLSIFLRRGFNYILVKNNSISTSQQDRFSFLIAVYKYVFKVYTFVFLILALVYIFFDNIFSLDKFYLLIFSISSIFLTLYSLNSAYLQGLDKINSSSFFLNISVQALFSLSLPVVLLFNQNDLLFSSVLYLCFSFLNFILSFIYCYFKENKPKIYFNLKVKKTSSWYFFIISLVEQIFLWFGQLYIFLFFSSEVSALYNVSQKIYLLCLFGLTLINIFYSRRIINSFYNRDYNNFYKFLKETFIISWVMGLSIIVFVGVFLDDILSFYGDSYIQANYLFIYFILPVFFSYLFGPSAYLLMMIGNEKLSSHIYSFILFLFIILSILIYYYRSLKVFLIFYSLFMILSMVLHFIIFVRKGFFPFLKIKIQE